MGCISLSMSSHRAIGEICQKANSSVITGLLFKLPRSSSDELPCRYDSNKAMERNTPNTGFSNYDPRKNCQKEFHEY